MRLAQPHRRGLWCAAAFIITAGCAIVLRWQEVPPVDATAAVAPHGPFQLPAGGAGAEPDLKNTPAFSGWPTGVKDVVGSAPDLKRVFDDFVGSPDARLRRIAARAFNACLPAFLAAVDQSASPENLIAALPAEQRVDREKAYRTLYARCHRLLSEPRSTLEKTRLTLERDAMHTPPGVRAQEQVLAGEIKNLGALVVEALSSGDANDVAALAGIASKLVRSGSLEAGQAELLHALETDAALSLVSCDLGRDCSANSLWALQLCAVGGLCGGDVLDRLALLNKQDGIDAIAVERQRSQLLQAIRTGQFRAIFNLLHAS